MLVLEDVEKRYGALRALAGLSLAALPLLVYRNAFENGRYGCAAALTVVTLARHC